MGYRTFTDRDGHSWEVRDRTKAEWRFEPAGGNPSPELDFPAPGYERDPFELSIEELQRLLDKALEAYRAPRQRKSPFLDD